MMYSIEKTKCQRICVDNQCRDLFWDSIKFILIFLVVYGHVLEINNPVGGVNRIIFNFIYSFHMPLFIFISGRFSHIHNVDRYKKSIFILLETYLIFELIFQVILKGKNFELAGLLTPSFHLWYLLTIVYYRLFVLIIPRRIITEYPIFFIIISFIVSIFCGFLPIGRLLSLQRTLGLFPFFVLGYYSVNIDIKKCFAKVPKHVYLAYIVLLFIVFYFVFNDDLVKIQCMADSYPSFKYCFYRIVYILIAGVTSIVVIELAPDIPMFSMIGKNTLFIFVFHYLFKGVLFRLIDANILSPVGWLLPIYSLVIVLSLSFFCQFKLSKIILNPISRLFDYFHKH